MKPVDYIQCSQELKGKQHGLWNKNIYPNGCPLCTAERWGTKWNGHNNNRKEVTQKMVFEENNPTDFKFTDDNPLLEGTLIRVQENIGANDSMLYTLEVNGKPINVWGCTILDQRMVGIKEGDLIQIVYKGLGEAKGGKNPPKLFQVLKDKPVENIPAEIKTDPVPSTPGTLV